MNVLYTDSGQRAQALGNLKKVVIKVGTRLLTGMDNCSKGERVAQLVEQIARCRDRGMEVILVSSGAIGAGMVVLGTKKRPASLPLLQAHAAVGQSRLMYLYETACAKHGFHCAQILLTAADVQDRERHLNVTSCIDALLSSRVLPVINENDSVSVEEIRFGDNDNLAALVAAMIKADLTILLTSVDGLHEMEGSTMGKRISVVPRLTGDVRKLAKNTNDTQFSVGGMITKLQAADLVTKAGENLCIADGRDFGVLERVLNGEDVGTLFTAVSETKMPAQRRYLAFFADHAGEVVVDDGAEKALREFGRSLLPSGILAVRGEFRRGDTVRVLNPQGIEVARGVTNYDFREIDMIKGRHSSSIKDLLGYEGYEAVIHRNYMVLT